MCRLLETIKYKNGALQNIKYHNERFNRSRAGLFGTKNNLLLQEHIIIPAMRGNGTFKCRIIYSRNIESVEFIPYQIRQVRTLKLVHDNDIEYTHKYLDRSCIEKHLSQTKTDDILIVKNGLITDVSYANIIFYDGIKWVTPSAPLLNGTKRSQLLDIKIIYEEDIKCSDIRKFKKAKLINAMLDMEDSQEISINNIFL